MSRNATMKDIAIAANVSVGTVSNVIKGDPRVTLSMVQRVQAAMRKVGYHTHTPPRANNKLRRTKCVGVIVPTVQDSNFAGIYAGVNHILTENDYLASLCISSEIQAREQKAIEQFVKNRAEGIVIVTCQPDSGEMFQSVYDNGTPLVFVDRAPQKGGFPLVSYDCAKHMEQLTKELLAEGKLTFALVAGPRENSNEAAYIDGFLSALDGIALPTPVDLMVMETNFNKESAFSAMVARLRSKPVPDVVITTSIPLLAGVRQAVSLLEPELRPEFVSLGEDSWAPTVPGDARIFRRDSMGMGEQAATLLLGILNGDGRDKQVVVNHARFKPEPRPEVRQSVRLRNSSHPLHILMLDDTACSAVEELLPAFTKSTGLQVKIEKRSVVEIAAMVRDPLERNRFDILQLDQPWLGEAAEDGLLYNLDHWLDANPDTSGAWLPGVLDAYCRHGGHYYTIPFLFGAQLLFYRKDLFDDPDLRSRFRKRHHYDLRSPKTWQEFNQTAAFFTRALNPDSPVEFGTTLGGQNPNGAICEYLPRLMSFREGSLTATDVIDSLSSVQAEAALANYIESYRYAPPSSPDFWWDEQAELFRQGHAAMMILFHDHVSSLADRSKSKVIGKIGYDIIPGGMPMLGGWTLGVNRTSAHITSALEFLGWVSGQDIVIPLTVLGGAPPTTKVYHNSELCGLYPWLPKVVESFARSTERNVSKVTTHGKIEERVFENILGGAVHQAVTGTVKPADALLQAQSELVRLIANA